MTQHHIPILPPLGLMVFIIGLLFLILNDYTEERRVLGWVVFILCAFAGCLMIKQGFAQGL